MKKQIEKNLSVLSGQRMWAAGRAADLEWFQFGARRLKKNILGGATTEVGDYAIHVQCSWRIISPLGILVGSQDRFSPSQLLKRVPKNFDWDVKGANQCDFLVAKIFEMEKRQPFIVKKVRSDFAGSLSLEFNDQVFLEIFPDNSQEVECWRFFQPGQSKPHLVVTGKGIQKVAAK